VATNPLSLLTWLHPTSSKKAKKCFTNTKYHEIYHDDGIVIFEGKQNLKELRKWLENFQQLINEITCSTFLQFMMEVWDNSLIHNKKQMSTKIYHQNAHW